MPQPIVKSELPIVQKIYDLIKWYVPILNRLPSIINLDSAIECPLFQSSLQFPLFKGVRRIGLKPQPVIDCRMSIYRDR